MHASVDEEGSEDMREILFRGKRKDNGEWVEGYIVICNEEINHGKVYMCDSVKSIYFNGDTFEIGDFYEVDSDTVGECTGLPDKNGKKIFEGDIVSGTALSRERTGVIVWIGQLAGFGVRYTGRDDPTAWQESSILKDIERHKYSEFCARVIGNIHDNPGLLEVEK